MTDEMREIEIVFEDGQVRRITIPAAWRTTFGAVVPTERGAARGWGLRVWESEQKQRAVFTQVQSFRDLSIPVMCKAIRKFGTTEWWQDDGTWDSGEKADLVEHEWQPQDSVKFGTPPFDPEIKTAEMIDPDDPWAVEVRKAHSMRRGRA